MKILLTGATGLVGKHLAHAAFERGHEIIALGRSPERITQALGIPSSAYLWDPEKENASFPKGALAGVDAVIHLMGDPIAKGAWNEEKKARILNSRVKSTKALAEAIAALPDELRPKTWICASAVGIYGNRADEELTEASPTIRHPGDFLSEVCHAWEEAAKPSGQPIAGVRTIHLRFGVIVAYEGGALETMALPFRLGAGGRLGSGRQWMSWIHIEDVVGAALFALEKEPLSGAINVTSPAPARNSEFTKTLSRTLSMPALFAVPEKALKTLLGEKAQLVLSSQKVLPERLLKAGYRFRFPELKNALSDLLETERFETYQWIPRPVDSVFAFFSDASNLERITPPWLQFSVRDRATSQITKGDRIFYDLKIHGVPVKWESEIDLFEPNRLFRDTQLRGPYRSWEHTHTFIPTAKGTLIKDEVRYLPPLGRAGRLAGAPWVKRDLKRIFAYRREAIAGIFS